ncbi:MAG: hypothetical protein GX145_05800 [Clostridiaceae bacterium]|jgi:phosphoesterase RecJ-like protein|nr:DHH family phosphoesterase [Bacillota bacterium]NLN52301.1 hypothetical protein [Clostridiaceae bacterium]
MEKIGSLNRVFNVLSELSPQHILILPHVRIDADALGASYGLAEALEQLGIQTRIILDEYPSNNIKFISHNYSLDIFSGKLLAQLKKPDLIIFLDHNETARLNQRAEILDRFPEVDLLIIDHHLIAEKTEQEFINNKAYPQRKIVTWLESDRSSVSEMVAELYSEYNQNKTDLSPKFALNHKIASSLLAGIYGDTGGLRYSNTSRRTFEICAFLMEHKLEVSYISEQLFGEKSLDQLKLVGEVFAKSNLNQAENMIWFTVTADFLEKYDVTQDDLEGLCSQMREVENIDLAVLIREVTTGEIRVNLRSNDAIDVSNLAMKFGGGGHARAAGITLLGDYDLNKFETELIEEAELMLNGKSN